MKLHGVLIVGLLTVGTMSAGGPDIPRELVATQNETHMFGLVCAKKSYKEGIMAAMRQAPDWNGFNSILENRSFEVAAKIIRSMDAIIRSLPVDCRGVLAADYNQMVALYVAAKNKSLHKK